MEGDPRECRRADGMSKVTYESKAQARRAARRTAARTGTGRNLHAYRCANCAGIHLGNDPRP